MIVDPATIQIGFFKALQNLYWENFRKLRNELEPPNSEVLRAFPIALPRVREGGQPGLQLLLVPCQCFLALFQQVSSIL